MPIPARILRAAAEDIKRPDTGKSACRDHILAVGQCLMARYGRTEITFTNLAIALCMGTTRLRNHFADLDALLGEILRRHLQNLSAAIGNIPPGATDRPRARRAAYYAFTRSGLGGFTDAHALLLRDRQLLPPDERSTIDEIYNGLGPLLAGSLGEEALDLLDNPRMSLARVETILATPTAELTEAPPPAKSAPTLHIPNDPDAPGAWIFNAGIPGMPPAPATFSLPKPAGAPQKPGLRTALMNNFHGLTAPPGQAPPPRSAERKLRALTRKLMTT